MYAVFSSGGKQYRVEAGTTLTLERLDVQPGGSVVFDRVLLLGDGEQTVVGTPLVDGATVRGTVLGEELGPKLIVFKFKQKVKYRRRTGHRQHLVRVRIDAISASAEEERAAPKARRPRARPEAGEKGTAAASKRASTTTRSKKPTTASRAKKPATSEE